MEMSSCRQAAEIRRNSCVLPRPAASSKQMVGLGSRSERHAYRVAESKFLEVK